MAHLALVAVLSVTAVPDLRASTLAAGDLVVLGWSAVNDTVRFATLVDIPAGTVVKITDKGWDQMSGTFTSATTGDGVITWTASANIAAGTVFSLYLGGSDASTILTNETTGWDLSADLSVSGYSVTDPIVISGDGVFLYQDSDANPYFLFGLNNSAGTVDASNWNTSIGATLRDSMLPSGAGSQNALVNGSSAVGLPGGASQQDHVQYTGPTSVATRATWLARITDVANWSGDNVGATSSSVGTQLGIETANVAPSLTNVNGDSVAFVEGGSATLLDAGGNASVSDPDSADFAGGSVTVAIVGNRVTGEDGLSIVNQGSGAGQVGLAGPSVTYGGTLVGTYTGGTGANDLVVTLNANATPTVVTALVRTLTYVNSNGASPSTASRTVRITVADGDGGTSSNADVTVSVTGVNDAPTVANAIPNQNATEDAAFNFQFGANTFADADGGATLTYSAQLAGGGTLPAWLSFDAATRTFSGTPANGDVGTVSLDVIASDGNGGTVTDTFNVVVANTNDAPTVANAIPNRNATEDAAFTFQFAANTFADADAGAMLTYAAQLAGGGALPPWLSFDATTRTFSGTPANGDVGTVSVDVIADDGNGGTVTDTFDVVVANSNDAPTVANAIPNQNAAEDTAFTFQFAANTFADADAGATLAYATQLAGGGALPAWLSFDAATRTFSGTPANGDVGTVSLDVSANDGNGGMVADTFNVVVANSNDAPTVANAIPNRNATEGAAFTFQFAANTFADADPGDTLIYAAQLSGGGTLPAWLSFDAVTRTFSGTPTNGDVGTVSLAVIADDGNGGTVTDTFDVVVANSNDVPTVAHPIPDLEAGEGGAFTFQFAANTFADVDAGDSLTYAAQTSGGGTLPAWLTFDGGTRTFSGTPAFTDRGTLLIDVVASDGHGGTVADTLALAVGRAIVMRVRGASPDGSYKAGNAIQIDVEFDRPVVVTGTPTLLLETGSIDRVASYVSGTGTPILTFAYVVASGDQSPDLDYVTMSALAPNGGAIRSGIVMDAGLTLPSPGSALSLSGASGLVVDAEAPAITIGAPSATSTSGAAVTFEVTYTDAATISLASSHVTLISTGTATGVVRVGGTAGTRTVTIADIDGVGTLAIAIAGATATDEAGNVAPATGPSAAVSVVAESVTTLSPTSGLATGGVVVTLRGAGFAGIVAPIVTLGGAPVRSVEVRSDAEMRVVTPALGSGGAVDLVVFDGASVVETLIAAYTPLDVPSEPSVDSDGDSLPDAWELMFGLDALSAGDASQDPDGDGLSSSAEHQTGSHPRGFWRRAFAEGVSNETFGATMALFNPGVARSSVVVRYLPEGGTPLGETFALDAHATVRRGAADVSGLPSGAFATSFESDEPIVADAVTTWDATGYGAGAEHAVAPAPTWYLAEGSTVGPFDLFYLIANPGSAPTDVDVTFLRPSPAAPLVRRYTVPGRGRVTVWVDVTSPELAATDVSAIVQAVGGAPIVVERAMYARDGSGRFGAAGHRAAAAPQAATTWHLAEGYVGGFFDTYLLVANPQASDATVRIEVLDAHGVQVTQNHDVPARSRLTVYAGDLALLPGPVAFTVQATNAVPVVVERAMWWRAAAGQPWVEAHASAGVTGGALRWGLADLRDGGPRNESQYVFVQNVGTAMATVELTVFVDERSVTRSYIVAPASRLTIDLAADVPEARGRSSSATVRSTEPSVVEASRYWDADGLHWSAGVNVRGTPLP